MRSLIIHLGLSKTATTSLQTEIFPHLPGYVGKFPSKELPSTALLELTQLYISGRASRGNKHVLEIDERPVWFPALKPWVEELVASDEDIVLWSDESLSAWPPVGDASDWPVMDGRRALPRRGSHPIVGFFQQLRELLPQIIELKTILTLRNQSDWLISLAAQKSVDNTEFVERLIRGDDAFLDYYAITKDLERLRGPENHLTLLFENGLAYNVHQILEFSGYSPADFKNLEMSQARVNVRRSEAGWSVRRVTPSQRLDRTLQRVRDRLPFLDQHLSSNVAWRHTLRPLIGSEARQRVLDWTPATRKPVSISLTQEQQTAIKSHCAASNEGLSAHLNVDLKVLGY